MSAVDFGGAVWRKSSRSGGQGSDDSCVELARAGTVTGVRDSRNPAGGMLTFPAPGWRSFLATFRR